MKVKIKDIKTNPNNPRVIRDEQFKKLVKSIQEFPEMLSVRKLVCTPDMVVLGGNMRLKALQSAGIKEVDVEIVDWDEQKQKEFIIKDNVSFGEWNHEQLANEWDAIELQEWGLELPVNVDVEILEAEDDEYEMPDAIHSDVVLGDLIEIGEHRLLCGDSTDSDAVAKLMNGKHADMVFTDPPYGMNAVSKSGVLKARYKDDILNDSNTNVAKDSFNLSIAMFPDALQVWWGANYYSSILPDSECWIVWDKNNGQSDQTDCELAWCNARSVVRQYTQASEKRNRIHPTQKPVGLVHWTIERFCPNAKMIVDYFLGSGTTMFASQQLNRVCYGMELDTKYCQVIIDRMMKAFPELPVKINGKAYKK